MRSKISIKNTFPLPLPPPTSSFPAAWRTGSYSQFITHCSFCSPGRRVVPPAPAWCPLHRRQSFTNPFIVSPSHSQQFSMNYSNVHHSFLRCSLSRTVCSSLGVPPGYKPYQETCSSKGSSLHRSAAPCQEPAPA